MNKTAKYAIGGVVLAGVVALAVVAANKNKTKATEVRIEGVESRDLVASVTASGQIQPRTKVDVSADVTGKIVRLVVKEGEMVTKGQLLLQIDPEQATAALQPRQRGAARTAAHAVGSEQGARRSRQLLR